MTSARLRKPILTKQILFPTYFYIHHLRENTLNISQVWATKTLGNQFSSSNWLATDLPQLGSNSFQHTAGASSWSCVLTFCVLTCQLFLCTVQVSFVIQEFPFSMAWLAPLCFISPASAITHSTTEEQRATIPCSIFFHNQDCIWMEPYKVRYKILKMVKIC